MVLVRSATTGERCTFWPPPLLWTLRLGATAARRVLHILSPLLAPATSLSIIFIAYSPLLPRSAPFPASHAGVQTGPRHAAANIAHRVAKDDCRSALAPSPPPAPTLLYVFARPPRRFT